MTQFLTFALSFDDIFKNIKLYTSYLAGKRAQTALSYDRVAAINLDRPLFDVIIEDSVTNLALTLGSRVASLTIDGDIIRFTIQNPLWLIDLTRFDTPPNPVDQQTLLRIFRSYVTSDTIRRWLTITGLDIPDGITTACATATELSTLKLESLQLLLTPPVVPPARHIPKASPRFIPPIG